MYINQHRIADLRSTAHADPSGIADLRKIWTTLLRRWSVVIAGIAATVALAAAWLAFTPSIYTATTTLLIEPRKTNTVKEEAIVSNLPLDANTIATEVALIKSFAVFTRVAEQLNLKNSPAFKRDSEKINSKRSVSGLLPSDDRVTTDAGKKLWADADAARTQLSPEVIEIIEQLEAGTSVQRVAITYFMEVSFAHENAEISALVANAIAAAYLDEQLEARYQAAQRAATWLSDRAASLRNKLEASERALADHRAKHNLAKPEAGTLADQQASTINTELVGVRSQIAESKARYEQAQRVFVGGAAVESLASIINSPAVGGLRAQEMAIAREEADLQTRYGPAHPAMLKIRAQQADINRQIKREIGRVVQTLKADYEFAQEKERSLTASLSELTGSRDVDDEAIIRLRELERDAQSNRSLYDATLSRFKEAEQQISLKTPDSRVIEPAFVPVAPSFPKKGTVLLLAAFCGLLFGAAGISVLEFGENGFTGASQLEQTLGLPVLAMVPTLKAAERNVSGRTITLSAYLMTKPHSRFGESVRSARLLTRMSGTPAPKLVLITSSTSAEGKTTIATSLAYSAAFTSRQRVLLLDCDLRARSASKQLKLGSKRGLSDAMNENARLHDVIYPSELPSLDILPAGTELRSPQALLESGRMATLFLKLREVYDVIYIDAPPLLPVIDTTLLLPLVDRILFVVSWRNTPRRVAIGGAQLLANFRSNISGVIVNNVEVEKLVTYDPANTYYHKSYREYYVS